MTPIGLGRDPAGMRAVADATGVDGRSRASGYHRDAHYPAGHWVHDATVEMLADRIVTDLTRGHAPGRLDRPRRCRSTPPAPARSRAAPRTTTSSAASGAVSRPSPGPAPQTGAAILVHTEIGTAGHEIVDLLEAAGATTDRIALAHLDRNPDWELHAEIAARGVTLEYDTIGRTKYHPDSVGPRPDRGASSAAGHLDRIVLGLDLGAARLPPRLRGRTRACATS